MGGVDSAGARVGDGDAHGVADDDVVVKRHAAVPLDVYAGAISAGVLGDGVVGQGAPAALVDGDAAAELAGGVARDDVVRHGEGIAPVNAHAAAAAVGAACGHVVHDDVALQCRGCVIQVQPAAKPYVVSGGPVSGDGVACDVQRSSVSIDSTPGTPVLSVRAVIAHDLVIHHACQAPRDCYPAAVADGGAWEAGEAGSVIVSDHVALNQDRSFVDEKTSPFTLIAGPRRRVIKEIVILDGYLAPIDIDAAAVAGVVETTIVVVDSVSANLRWGRYPVEVDAATLAALRGAGGSGVVVDNVIADDGNTCWIAAEMDPAATADQ